LLWERTLEAGTISLTNPIGAGRRLDTSSPSDTWGFAVASGAQGLPRKIMVSQISLFCALQLMIDKNHQTCRTAVIWSPPCLCRAWPGRLRRGHV